MDYVALRCKVKPKNPGSDIVIGLLSEVGFESFVETEMGVDAFIPEANFEPGILTEKLANDFFSVDFEIEKIAHQNWNQKWEDDYPLVNIDNRCVIRAPFHEFNESVEYDILIQPQMSFGTGHHATTELMVREILSMNWSGKKVLDMGSGTGVLAILAEKMKAEQVLAIEIDEHAAINCQENVDRNNCIHIDVENGTSSQIKARTFDAIFANINLNVLLGDLKLYIDSLNPRGEILLSGFYFGDRMQLIEPLERLGLLQCTAKHIDNWSILRFQKKD